MKWLFATIAAAAVAIVALLWVAGNAQVSGPYAQTPVTDAQRATAAAYLERSLAPLPEGWAFETFEPAPGVKLRAGRIEAADPKGTVVLVPGYTAPLDLYPGTIRAFHEAGYTVAGLEQRGQGGSMRVLPEPDKGHVESYDDLASDLAAFVATLPKPVLIYGNSMGGHIAMRMAGAAEPDVAGYALLVPMVKINTAPFPYPVAGAITRFHSALGFDGERAVGQAPWTPEIAYDTPGRCSSVPQRAWTQDALYVSRPDLRVRGTTNGWVQRTMASTAVIAAPDFLAKIDEPVFMVTAGVDHFVDTDAAAQACKAMGDCRREHYDEAYHCITNEDDARTADIHAKTVEFFDQVVGR